MGPLETGEQPVGKITRGERLQIMLTDVELKAVDDWRFTKRMPSRAAAIRELLKRGLAAEGFDVAVPGEQSKQFGVVSDPSRTDKKSGKRS